MKQYELVLTHMGQPAVTVLVGTVDRLINYASNNLPTKGFEFEIYDRERRNFLQFKTHAPSVSKRSRVKIARCKPFVE